VPCRAAVIARPSYRNSSAALKPRRKISWRTVTDAIITVPATSTIRNASHEDAGKIAGSRRTKLSRTNGGGACLRFGKSDVERIAVYDLGGGTFDISILQMSDGVFQVSRPPANTFSRRRRSDERNNELDGRSVLEETGIDLRKDRLALQRLKEVAERAKCELSSSTENQYQPSFHRSDATDRSTSTILNRTEFEGLIVDLIEQTWSLAARRLKTPSSARPDR